MGSVKSGGFRKNVHHYYVRVYGYDKNIEIPYETYRYISEDSNVYVVHGKNGEIRGVYSENQYIYIGERYIEEK